MVEKIPCLLPLFHNKKFITDFSKAHGGNMTGIRMLKVCDQLICKLLNIIFKFCLTLDIFPSECKKANVVLIYKTYTKFNQYRTSSVLKTTDLSLFLQVFEPRRDFEG